MDAAPLVDAQHTAAAPAAAPIDALDLAYAAVAVAVCVAAWCALLLAELGLFAGAIGAVAALATGLVAAVLVVRWTLSPQSSALSGQASAPRSGPLSTLSPRPSPPPHPLSTHDPQPSPRARPLELAAALALLLLGVAILGRPHEYVLGGLDPGIYVNTAALIAERGGVVWQDPELPAMSDAARAALFREVPSALTEGSRLIGFYFGGLASGRIVPHGMHLFPAAMAVGYALGGLRLALLVPGLLALVGVAGAALIARRLAGSLAGGLAALLLLLNPAESWFGRYPAAETMLQAALFGGVALLLLALERRSSRLGFAAGLLVGLVHLAKIETFVVPLAIGLVYGWRLLVGRLTRLDAAFLAGYALTLTHAVVHVSLIAGAYAVGIYARSLPSAGVLAAAAALGLVPLLVLLAAPRLARCVRRELMEVQRVRAAGLAVVGLLLLLGLYAWYVRPLDPWGEVAAAPEAVQSVVRNRLQTLPRLGWYLPPLALLLAGAGLARAAWRTRDPAVALLLAVAVFEAIVVVSDPRITPEYPWAARRWVGILIPVVVVLASCQIAWLMPRRRLNQRRGGTDMLPGAPGCGFHLGFGSGVLPRAVLPAGLALAVTAASAGASLPLLRQREYRGAADLIAGIVAEIRPDGVVLLDDDLVGWRLSTPLTFLGRRSSFVLFNRAAEDDRLVAALDGWERAGRTVYWLRTREGPAYYQWGRYWRPDARWQTALTEVASTVESPPSGTRAFDVPIVLYEALASQS